MKKILPLIISLLFVAPPSNAQQVRRDDSYDQTWTLEERAREARSKNNEYPNGDFIIYPSRSMSWGKGFSGGLAKVTVDGKNGFIDSAGNLVVKPQFDDAGSFEEGLAPVELNDKWGYVNKKGKIVVPLKFDWALGFYEGRALVAIGDKVGYINKSGQYIWKPSK